VKEVEGCFKGLVLQDLWPVKNGAFIASHGGHTYRYSGHPSQYFVHSTQDTLFLSSFKKLYIECILPFENLGNLGQVKEKNITHN
jgi:hypothetical protein